jgi:hypothetical protein
MDLTLWFHLILVLDLVLSIYVLLFQVLIYQDFESL